MKKFLLMSVVVGAALLLTGCEYESCRCTHTETPCNFHAVTIEMPIQQSDWQYMELDAPDNAMFYVHFPIKELTASVYDYAVVNVYHEYNTGTKNAYQVLLPETTYKNDTLDDNSVVYFQHHVDYAYGIGYVEVFYTVSDAWYPLSFTPPAMHCRLQIVY